MKTPPKTKAASKTSTAAAKGKAVVKSRAAAKGKVPPARSAAKKKQAAAKAGPKPKAARKPAAKKGPAATQPDPSALLAALAVTALEDLKGVDIKVLDVRELTPITDCMVICTGTSNRHVRALAENVLEKARGGGHRPIGVEGLNEGEWVLVDLNGVLVHVMQAQPRLFYQLEKLWDMNSAGSQAA
jgi:ribosome-associated protein